ncbi:MAG: tetratricopeptide repeat protein [Nevskia sp.]|nr:tetratricopeptide repeat protein [Nevskia sp.]
MKRSARSCLLLLPALLLAACATRAPKPPAIPPPPVQEVPKGPDKGDPEQRFQEALKLLKAKKPQEAKDAFAKLAQDFPEYAGPLNDLGVLQAQGKQREQAIGSFIKACADNPADDFGWAWLGILYRENNDYGRAEQAYLKAISIKPDKPATHLNLGILYDVYLKRPRDALQQYREYQRLAGRDGRPVVTAWINELQDSLGPAAGSAGAPAAAPSQPPAPQVVEHKR